MITLLNAFFVRPKAMSAKFVTTLTSFCFHSMNKPQFVPNAKEPFIDIVINIEKILKQNVFVVLDFVQERP